MPRLALPVLGLVLASAFAAAGAGAQASLDLSETVRAGEFRAYRLELLEPAVIDYGGWYVGAVTSHPVLPIVAWKQAPSGLWGVGIVLAYDESRPAKVAWVHALARSELGEHEAGEDYRSDDGYWFTTANRAPAGVYTFVLASAPAEQGQAHLRLRVWGAARVLAAQQGESFYARGLDHSDRAYDLEASSRGTGTYSPIYGRMWGYTGAELPAQVEGRLFGYMGYHAGDAQWRSPSGQAFSTHVLGQPGGAWTAAFPEEHWHKPLCEPGGEWGCRMFHDDHRDPPFALAADVRV